MKTFKIADCIMQAFMFAAVLVFLGTTRIYLGGPLFYMYFIVGGWQVMSMLVHFAFPAKARIGLRRMYHVLLIVTIIVGVVMYLFPAGEILFYLIGMLFWSPALAILYFICCLMETARLRQPVAVEEQAL